VAFAVVPETRADSEGRYRLQGLAPGRYSVAAEHPDWQRTARDLEVRDDETRLDLRLGEGVEVAGRAIDAAGRGLSGVRVGLSSPDGADRETVTGTGGAFRFARVGEGRHRLQAEKEGYGRPPAEEIQVSGGPVRGVELRLDRGVTVTGRVLGLDFQDLARVQVAAARAGISGEQQGRTDYQGRYRIADLEPGDWTLLARLPDGRLAKSRVAVPPGGGEIALDLEFERGLALSGRVLVGSVPVAGAVVFAGAGDGAGSGGGVSGPQGEFRIEGLRPGTYNVTVTVPQGGAAHRQTLELRGDSEIVIQLPEAGAPQPEASPVPAARAPGRQPRGGRPGSG
jgi:large repetitive protein